ncbi:MAG: DUF983 domain-containing protein [Pseudomonadota bacterium]
MTHVSPFQAGIRCRCPECGEGQVFKGFLEFKPACEACGADFSVADAGDGPAFFVMFAAMIFIVPAAMLFELGVSPPVWVHALVWPPVVMGFCIALLRPFKATLFALQWKNNAHEAQLDK